MSTFTTFFALLTDLFSFLPEPLGSFVSTTLGVMLALALVGLLLKLVGTIL